MKLFDTAKVKKFYSILEKMGRVTEKRYGGKCEKEIFVKRNVHKWLKNKPLILYVEEDQTQAEYKSYVVITGISFRLGSSSTDLNVLLYDATRPYRVWNEFKYTYNDVISLEGEWCDDASVHNKLIEMFMLNEEEKEYHFKAWDWSKYPKRKKKNQTEEQIRESLSIPFSVKAKTTKEAYKKVNKWREENEGQIIVGHLIKE